MVYQGLAFVKMTRLGDFGHDCTSKAIELLDGVPSNQATRELGKDAIFYSTTVVV